MDRMTKTEARSYVKRCREALRGFDAAIASGDVDALLDWAAEAMGSTAALAEYADQNAEAK